MTEIRKVKVLYLSYSGVVVIAGDAEVDAELE